MSNHSVREGLSKILTRLNPQQRLVVDTVEGPLLIVAGAGSGKTSVITARIALMLENGIPPSSILALTFTNKAAREMEERVKNLTSLKLSRLTISTFHAFGVQVLREQSQVVGLRPKFTIYDTSDKQVAIKESVKELKLSYELAEINALASLFSDIKTRRKQWDETTKIHQPLFNEYQELMTLHNAVDFDDLIIKPLNLFETHREIRDKYRRRYQYIMVDEFQDSSTIQYLLVKIIGEEHRNLCCVGDDDQSIYSWRGADFTNILNFEKDFPELTEIKLERNYRSTRIILNAANAVISNNNGRKDKNLWTNEQHDEMTIQYAAPDNDEEEGIFIAESILSVRIEDNLPYDKIGILVRTNALTRTIEEALLSYNIPYAVSGGISFFSRREIKDVTAYLRIIDNPDDDVSFLHIINTPRRGVGKTTLKILVNKAREEGYSLYSAASSIVFDRKKPVSDKIRGGLAEFIDLIERYRDVLTQDEKSSISLATMLREIVEEIEYWGYLIQEFQHNEKIAKWRYDNIQTFTNLLERWETHPDNMEPSLTRWLNRITLNTRDQLDEENTGKVNLMTIHASKGLEFDVVFLPGMEDGIMPHKKSVEENPLSLEEERRLFYVAITRARRKLFIASCRTRKIRNETITCVPSPFLEEIPQNLMENAESEDEVLDEKDIAKYFAKMPWK